MSQILKFKYANFKYVLKFCEEKTYIKTVTVLCLIQQILKN